MIENRVGTIQVMFCSNCGSSAGNSQIFCSSCGNRLGSQVMPNLVSASYSGQVITDFSSENAPKSMNFVESIKFSYKNYARFSGRASRSEYWYWMMFVWLGVFSSAFLMGVSELFSLLYLAFIFSAVIPGIARGVRRLHDINRSGAHLLLGIIPIVGPILLLVWFCKKGDAAANVYGPAQFADASLRKNMETDTGAITAVSDLSEGNSAGVRAKNFIIKYKYFALAATLLILLIGVTQSHLQYGKLISTIEVSEAQMNEFNNNEQKVYEENTSGSPLRFNSAESETIFENEVKRLAGMYESRISNAGKSVDDVSLFPWNLKHGDIQSRYLDHNRSWQNQLFTKSSDPYSEMYSEDIVSTWKDFCKELKSEVPWYLFGRFDSRIAEICISDSDPGLSN